MNKNLKIITINGIMGVLTVIFVVFGLVSGFIISPAWVCMKLWNTFLVSNTSVMPMNLYQGLLLWGVIALSFYAINGRKSLIGFSSYSKLTPEQIKDIVKRTRSPETAFLGEFEILNNDLKVKKDETKDDKSKSNEEIKG